MTLLHEILAVEKTVVSQANKLAQDTVNKFGKEHFFSGHTKTLKMLEDSASNAAVELASADRKELPTTVEETLEYMLQFWAKAEDVIFQKNVTNQKAVADIIFENEAIATNIPVDELLGLEDRLANLRQVLAAMPTLDASKAWEKVEEETGRKGAWKLVNNEVTTKTEKVMIPVVLYEATDKHPANVKESTIDKVVGTFTKTTFSGAATSLQKANVLKTVDELIAAVKQARMRANCIEVEKVSIGRWITNLILDNF